MLLQSLALGMGSKYPLGRHQHDCTTNSSGKNRQFKSKRCKWRPGEETNSNKFTNNTQRSQRSQLKCSRAIVLMGGRRISGISVNLNYATILLIVICFLRNNLQNGPTVLLAEGSLIIGDSAIEITELDQNQPAERAPQQPTESQQPSLILGSTSDGQPAASLDAAQLNQQSGLLKPETKQATAKATSGPLPPILSGNGRPEDVTDGDKASRATHDYDLNGDRKDALSGVLPAQQSGPSQADEPGSADEKAITGKVVDFELTPAGGHNKAKIKKKKKKKMKKAEEMEKKWKKKKAMEKKAMEMHKKEGMKKKMEEGKKKKKKFGVEIHGQKKKGKFKKKKWGKKVKKGQGVKKGKKGRKFLKDKGHKKSGFKTVYHKEEWGKSAKWHDIKRDKKWDEKNKVYKQKWQKIKGKKYKGENMKKFEKKKKAGKKYKKEHQSKFKKHKGEKFKKGHKKKKEEFSKKKEGGKKAMKKEMKKKKKKKKGGR